MFSKIKSALSVNPEQRQFLKDLSKAMTVAAVAAVSANLLMKAVSRIV